MAETTILQQDSKIAMSLGTHVQSKQKQYTMLTAMTIIAGRSHDNSDIARASKITGISKEEISRHINRYKVMWYD